MRKKLSRDEQISRGIADLVRLYIADHSDPVGMLMMAHGAYDDLETRYKLEVSTYARDAGISEEALRGLITKMLSQWMEREL